MKKDSFYFYDYIIDELNIDKEYLDLIKHEIDKRIYYYGDHFKVNYEKYSNIKFYLFLFIKIIYLLRNNILKRKSEKPIIISNAYFNFNDELRKLGYKVVFPELNVGNRYHFIGSLRILLKYEYIKKGFRTENLNIILSDQFQSKVIDFRIELKKYLLQRDVKALFVAYDMPFLEKILISIFKEINRPNFVFLHGLPTRYNAIDDNRADYLLVWGEKIKECYIRAGVDEKKIFVIGNPGFSVKPNNSLRNSLESILVITNCISPFPENSDKVILQDRGNLLTYLYSIQNVLQRFGVKKVRFRPHPFENSSWYEKNVDNNFFILDRDKLSISLEKTSLVIGSSSTVLLDALAHGVNYIVYEPIVDQLTLKNFRLVPPFDKSDARIVVATNEEELYNNIKSKNIIDPSVIKDYLGNEFNIDKVCSLASI